MPKSFLFPYEKIEKDSRIVLYGAGNVGKQFYSQIIDNDYCKVVLWTDKNYKDLIEAGYPLGEIETICNIEYDYLVLAILDKKLAIEAQESLSAGYKIDKSKIIWTNYIQINPDVEYAGYTDSAEKYYVSSEMEPTELLSSNSMEHVVRYLLCRDIINGVINESHLGLYQRMTMVSTGAEEKMTGITKAFSDYDSKSGLDDYLNMFKKLIASMESEGFLRTYCIPEGKNGYLVNGKHRYATALALEKKIWVKRFQSINGHYKNIAWFRDNGFSEKEIQMILDAFCSLYKKCGIFILFGAVEELWDFITKQISKELRVAGYVDLDFKDDYNCFCNLMRDNYHDNEKDQNNIEKKIHNLLLAPLRVRALVVTDEQNNSAETRMFYKRMKQVKERIRKLLFADTPIHTVILHGSDSKEEYEHMRSIWLSANSIKYAGMRVLYRYSKRFRMRMDEFKRYLNSRNIPLSEVCILGTAGMELYGLKFADDIDFCISDTFRKHIDEEKLPEGVHLKRRDSMEMGGGRVYKDELLIRDNELHYMYDQLKFVNLDILYGFKKNRNYEKDAEDIRRLEVFFDSVRAFNEKRSFRRQLENEIGRTW